MTEQEARRRSEELANTVDTYLASMGARFCYAAGYMAAYYDIKSKFEEVSAADEKELRTYAVIEKQTNFTRCYNADKKTAFKNMHYYEKRFGTQHVVRRQIVKFLNKESGK